MKTILLSMMLIASTLSVSAQQQQKDTSFHQNVNPYREFKKGQVLTTIGSIGLATTVLWGATNMPKKQDDQILFGCAFVGSGLLTIIGTVYKLQGVNYIYRPNQSGYWSFNAAPTNANIAFNF